MKSPFKLIFAVLIPIIILFLPTEWLLIDGMSVIDQRLLAIFILSALLWILEPIPVYTTSLLIMLLLLLFISDAAPGLQSLLKETASDAKPIKYSEVMASFGNPILVLFIGGFFLAISATKYRLDTNLARVLLKPFGEQPKYILLGLILITAIFSMFMSNTATTAMMLSILTPILVKLDPKDSGRVALLLAIPFAANIGGIGTPIGTPPNAVAMKYLTGDSAITFGSWMMIGVPFAAISLFFMWLILVKWFPFSEKTLVLNIKDKFISSKNAWIVYITFIVTILAWVTEDLHGVNSYVVAMIPIAVFSVTQVITKDDLKQISWDTIWLVAGGIALGAAMEKTGFSAKMIGSVPFDQFHPLLVVAIGMGIAYLMSNFMSNTATANLIIPILAVLGTNLSSLADIGGTRLIVLSVTFMISMAMMLPISTPPNSLAYASGAIKNNDMLKAGTAVGIIAIIMVPLMVFILNLVGYF